MLKHSSDEDAVAKRRAGPARRTFRRLAAIESLVEQNHMVGWREWLALPELGIGRIRAKVDTGARTSALHAVKVRPLKRDGQLWVSFVARPRSGGSRDRTAVQCVARAVGVRRVKNSNGGVEQRYVIVTPLEIGNRRMDIEITLTDRAEMGHEMLLGRTALRKGGFVVHPSKSHLQGQRSPAGQEG